MHMINSIIRRSFQYNFGKKKSTIVEFDIVDTGGEKIVKNITLKSNWRDYYPIKPQIITNTRGEYCFSSGGVEITNGDIQQMIKRIFQIINEIKN